MKMEASNAINNYSVISFEKYFSMLTVII